MSLFKKSSFILIPDAKIETIHRLAWGDKVYEFNIEIRQKTISDKLFDMLKFL